MARKIKNLSIHLDDDNPDTPKILNPLTGQGQRATYTDVLLFTLIEKVEALTELISAHLDHDSAKDEAAPAAAPTEEHKASTSRRTKAKKPVEPADGELD